MARKKAAFQGERGAFSEAALIEMLGKSVRPVACDSFADLFEAVEKGRADVGIIPIENTLIGSIHQNYDLLLEHQLYITGEIRLRVVHSLMTLPGNSLRQIKRVYSHPAALEQCRLFFAKHRHIEPVPFYDTAGAAKMIAETKPDGAAAIASPYAADLYGLKQLRRSLADQKSNTTRFLSLRKTPARFKGPAKTSVVFSLKNKPGALFKALSVFALRDIDLTKIESRPSRKKAWQYYFYIDFAGSIADEAVSHALDHLNEITHFVEVLGTYPLHQTSLD